MRTKMKGSVQSPLEEPPDRAPQLPALQPIVGPLLDDGERLPGLLVPHMGHRQVVGPEQVTQYPRVRDVVLGA